MATGFGHSQNQAILNIMFIGFGWKLSILLQSIFHLELLRELFGEIVIMMIYQTRKDRMFLEAIRWPDYSSELQ